MTAKHGVNSQMYEQEIWKSVVGFEKIYQVSNRGNIKRVKATRGSRVGYLLTKHINNKGYHRVRLRKENHNKMYYVHQLVALAFIGKHSEYIEINHKDGNPLNNNLENLEWTNRSKNTLHAAYVLKKNIGEGNYSSKLRDKDIPTIRGLLSAGKLSQREIAERFGVKRTTIQCIKEGRTWIHIN